MGQSLATTTFCVVDLETTGGSAAAGSMITEIGAVKICGGEVVGEFQSLVNPGQPIPGFITVLTGISDHMVIEQPPIQAVLPSFLEFAHGSVLVAHNAPFDIGFLKHFCREIGIDWPRFQVIDTATLARKTLMRGETPNVKLATLAAKFSKVTPDHRALTDARATVDVLHALFERLGSFGVSTIEELSDFSSRVSAEQRKKRHLADHLPAAPGVYLFRGRNEEVLYVGTSGNLRSRVKSYFTSSEQRSRMAEMISCAQRVDAVECATTLEAGVRELRLIAAHRPSYNRRSKFPQRQVWIKLTAERWPRLSLVRQILNDGADYVGPFSKKAADSALAALYEVFPIRQCTMKLRTNPAEKPCTLAELDRCLAPCDGRLPHERYLDVIAQVRTAIIHDPAQLVDVLESRMQTLASQERFEDAAIWRDRLSTLLYGIDRTQRIRSLTEQPELIVAGPDPAGWQVHIVRYGRLAGAGVLKRGMPSKPWIERLQQSAETVLPSHGPIPAALVEETEAVLRWLNEPGLRVVSGTWVQLAHGAQRHRDRYRHIEAQPFGAQ